MSGATEMSELLADAFSTVFIERVTQNAADHQVCARVLGNVDLSLGVVQVFCLEALPHSMI